MRTLGNILWHIPFCGFIRSIAYAIGGLFWCITIIGIPLGMGLFQLSLFTLSPFSKELVSKADLEILTGEEQDSFTKGWSMVIRILYFPFGLFMAIITITVIAIEFISLFGIPCGLVESKALSTIFNPINKKCVPRVVAEEIEKQKANITLNKYQKAKDSTAQTAERAIQNNDATVSITDEYLRKAESKTDEELKFILQHKEDYNPQLIKAAEKTLLDRITAITKSKTTTAEFDHDKYKTYQPFADKPVCKDEDLIAY